MTPQRQHMTTQRQTTTRNNITEEPRPQTYRCDSRNKRVSNTTIVEEQFHNRPAKQKQKTNRTQQRTDNRHPDMTYDALVGWFFQRHRPITTAPFSTLTRYTHCGENKSSSQRKLRVMPKQRHDANAHQHIGCRYRMQTVTSKHAFPKNM